jgi:hypothetical protein
MYNFIVAMYYIPSPSPSCYPFIHHQSRASRRKQDAPTPSNCSNQNEGMCNKSLKQSKTKPKKLKPMPEAFLSHNLATNTRSARLQVIRRHKTRPPRIPNRFRLPPPIILQAQNSKNLTLLEPKLLRYLCRVRVHSARCIDISSRLSLQSFHGYLQ